MASLSLLPEKGTALSWTLSEDLPDGPRRCLIAVEVRQPEDPAQLTFFTLAPIEPHSWWSENGGVHWRGPDVSKGGVPPWFVVYAGEAFVPRGRKPLARPPVWLTEETEDGVYTHAGLPVRIDPLTVEICR